MLHITQTEQYMMKNSLPRLLKLLQKLPNATSSIAETEYTSAILSDRKTHRLYPCPPKVNGLNCIGLNGLNFYSCMVAYN